MGALLRSNTGSDAEPSTGKQRKGAAAPKPPQNTPLNGSLIGVSVEMNPWPRRPGGILPQPPQAAPNKPLPLPPAAARLQHAQSPQQQAPSPWPRARQSPRGAVPGQGHERQASSSLQQQQQQQQQLQQLQQLQTTPGQPPAQPQPQPQPPRRASSVSSQDGGGRNSRRGSRTSRLAPIPTVGIDGEEMYYPLTPAPPPQRRSDSGRNILARVSAGEVLPPEDEPVPVLPPEEEEIVPGGHGGRGIGRGAGGSVLDELSFMQTAALGGPPSVYWSDDDAASNAASNAAAETATIGTAATSTAPPGTGTFYHDVTPPLPKGGFAARFSEKTGVHRVDDVDADEAPSTADEKTEDDAAAAQQRDIRFARHRTQFREISTAVVRDGTNRRSGVPVDEHTGAPEMSPATGAGKGPFGTRPADGNDGDDGDDGEIDDLDDDDPAMGEFVNGCYVPPGLRNGRAPGRKPVDERERDVADSEGSEHEGGRSGRLFWIVAGAMLLTIMSIAVGVGVGVGVTLAKKNEYVTQGAAGTESGQERLTTTSHQISSVPETTAAVTTATAVAATATPAPDAARL